MFPKSGDQDELDEDVVDGGQEDVDSDDGEDHEEVEEVEDAAAVDSDENDDDDDDDVELKEGADADAVDGGQVGTKLSDWT